MISAKIFFLLYLWVTFELTKSDVYTAISHLEGLLNIEQTVVQTIQNYVRIQEIKLERVKKQIQKVENEHKKTMKNSSEYVTHPIKSYLLLKRLAFEWEAIIKSLESAFCKDIWNEMARIRENGRYPDEEDVKGAIKSLARLEKIYNWESNLIASGKLNDFDDCPELSSDDCYQIGLHWYNEEDYRRAGSWMREALQRKQNDDVDTYERKTDILHTSAYCEFKVGNRKEAAQLINEILIIDPNDDNAIEWAEYYRNLFEGNIVSEDEIQPEIKEDVNYELDDDAKYKSGLFPTDHIMYEKLCRGEQRLTIEYKSKLKCNYFYGNDPFLRIGPFKLEEAFLDPRIVVYHDVVYDSEIEIIQDISKEQLFRSQIFNHTSNSPIYSDVRISKIFWFENDQHPVVETIRRRASYMTALNLEFAEKLQIANYGIGGHYSAHQDYFSTKDGPDGDRIATLLFYLTDVAQGGATVFTRIKASVKPQKGSAVFWYNLLTDGNGDGRTTHAACPVLYGSKWAANLWIREKGQEFLRPCHPVDNPDMNNRPN